MATGPIETHVHHSLNWENAAPGFRMGPRGRSANCGNGLSAQYVRLRSEINRTLVGEANFFETPDEEVFHIKAWFHFQSPLLFMSSIFELPGGNEVPGYIVDFIFQVGIFLKDIVDPRWTVGINRGNEAF